MKRLIIPLLVTVFTMGTAVADNDKGKAQGQGQGQAQGQTQPQSQHQGQGADKTNYGQVVSECNHRANERNLKGHDRKDFVEWCESRGARYSYDDKRYSRERDCYRKADDKNLAGDKRNKFLNNCFAENERVRYQDSDGKQYHPKVNEAVENSQKR